MLHEKFKKKLIKGFEILNSFIVRFKNFPIFDSFCCISCPYSKTCLKLGLGPDYKTLFEF